MADGEEYPGWDKERGLCAASRFQRVQDEVCSRPVSLGSFSEAKSIFDPELLKEVFLQLACEMDGTWRTLLETDKIFENYAVRDR